jgi:hypothetical protein
MKDYKTTFVNTDGANFPNTAAINASGPTATDGTEYVKDYIDDHWGARQALMLRANLTPNGVQESSAASQFMDALDLLFGNQLKDKQAYQRGFKALKCIPNAGAPLVQVDIDADYVYVEDLKISAVNQTWDITASGAGGLSSDSVAEQANTWYYIFLIASADGASVSTLAKGVDEDLTGTPSLTTEDVINSIVLPGGYTKKRLLSVVYNNGSSNIQAFSQSENFYIWDTERTVVSGVPSTSKLALTLYEYVPLFSNLIQVNGQVTYASSSNNVIKLFHHVAGVNTSFQNYRNNAGGVSAHNIDNPFVDIFTDDRAIDYQSVTGATSITFNHSALELKI